MTTVRVALIAGSTGIVSGNLAALLQEHGWAVYGPARKPSSTGGVIPVAADLRDRSTLIAALAGITPAHVFFCADPFQLLFLAGVVCLVVAHRLRLEAGPSSALGVCPIIFAGASGYFVCFWPCNHPVRRTLGLVFLPTIAGLGLMFACLLSLGAPSTPSTSVVERRVAWVRAEFTGHRRYRQRKDSSSV